MLFPHFSVSSRGCEMVDCAPSIKRSDYLVLSNGLTYDLLQAARPWP